MVERVTSQTLGSYMEENILKPLGMDSTSFNIKDRADILSRRADMSLRTADGAVVPSPTRFFSDNAPDHHGGGGIFSSPGDYVKLLISVLKNDGALLRPSTMDVLFAPCLPPDAITELRNNRRTQYKAFRESKVGSTAALKVIQPEEMNYAPGGQISEKEWLGGRKAGSMSWGGLPNLSWVLDRESGIALLFSAQILPPGDAGIRAAFERFEYAVYNGELGNIGHQN
jgi:CubicO group peptidase (beta-lactamase class C family)